MNSTGQNVVFPSRINLIYHFIFTLSQLYLNGVYFGPAHFVVSLINTVFIIIIVAHIIILKIVAFSYD